MASFLLVTSLATTRQQRVAAFAAAILLATSPASAGLVYLGGSSSTVYGVTSYGGAPQVAPSFIFNNGTGFNDILASPGGGFLTAAPIVANNIFETGVVAAPSSSSQTGGSNINGPFGNARSRLEGVHFAFDLGDAALCCSASYIVSSWTSNLLVTPGGLGGDPLTLLGIAGTLPDASSSFAASLVTHYYLNDVYQGTLAPLVLAQARNGNSQAIGSLDAQITMDGFGRFTGFAFNSIPGFVAAPGDVLKVTSTLTAFADPAKTDFWLPPAPLTDEELARMVSLVSSGVPEPHNWAMLIAGFGLIGAAARRRRAAATA
jgi:hypothetical protein